MERKGTEELSKLHFEEMADSYFAHGVWRVWKGGSWI